MSSPFTALCGDKVKDKENDVFASELDDCEVVGIYFSAHWCPPCRQFTPMLVDFYNKMKAGGKKFEIVFVSSDRDETSFKEYYSTMPWKAIPFGSEEKKKLSAKYEVRGIPALVLLDKSGNVITKDGRNTVMDDPECNEFPSGSFCQTQAKR